MLTVQCGFADINWSNRNRLMDSDIHIWRLWLPAVANHVAAAALLLVEDEHERARRYLHEKSKERFILSRAMLRAVISKYLSTSPRDIIFRVTGNKKPCIEGSDLQFNVAHSGDLVLIAIADIPVGIDTERVDEFFDFGEVLPVCFSGEETNIVEQHGREFFYRYWTRKEALAKALGSGLDSNILVLPCMDGRHEINAGIIGLTGNWTVSSFNALAGYTSSIAYPAPGKKTEGYDVSDSFGDLLGW